MQIFESFSSQILIFFLLAHPDLYSWLFCHDWNKAGWDSTKSTALWCVLAHQWLEIMHTWNHTKQLWLSLFAFIYLTVAHLLRGFKVLTGHNATHWKTGAWVRYIKAMEQQEKRVQRKVLQIKHQAGKAKTGRKPVLNCNGKFDH